MAALSGMKAKKRSSSLRTAVKKQKVKFQLAKVTKILLSADKVNRAGFDVDLNSKDPKTIDKKTGAKIAPKRQHGIFVLDLWVNTEKVGKVFSQPGQ